MKGITQSIWKQTSNGEWKLFFNTNHQEVPHLQKQDQSPLLRQYYTAMQTASQGNFKLGTLVMTPKGIGRIIKQDEHSATIKMSEEDSEEIFALEQISNIFFVYVKIYDKHVSNWYKLNMPVNASIEMLKEVLEELKIAKFSEIPYQIIAGGAELKDTNTFEQLHMRTGAKIVLSGMKMTQYSINRFCNTNNWWYSYLNDGITFSVSKPIKLLGVGMYGSQEGKTQNGTIKLFEGEMGGTLILEETAEVTPAVDDTHPIIPIMFSKGIKVKPNVDYMVEFNSPDYTYLYYGREGKKHLEGEKGVEWSFKFSNGTSHGTNTESGNFPEFYYFA